jgi:hypothetical protein
MTSEYVKKKTSRDTFAAKPIISERIRHGDR